MDMDQTAIAILNTYVRYNILHLTRTFCKFYNTWVLSSMVYLFFLGVAICLLFEFSASMKWWLYVCVFIFGKLAVHAEEAESDADDDNNQRNRSSKIDSYVDQIINGKNITSLAHNL